jgi:hypothetical protein
VLPLIFKIFKSRFCCLRESFETSSNNLVFGRKKETHNEDLTYFFLLHSTNSSLGKNPEKFTLIMDKVKNYWKIIPWITKYFKIQTKFRSEMLSHAGARKGEKNLLRSKYKVPGRVFSGLIQNVEISKQWSGFCVFFFSKKMLNQKKNPQADECIRNVS